MAESKKIHISGKNTKMGSIPSFSLTPLVTCTKTACSTCGMQGCYALKSYRMYPRVRTAWDENTGFLFSGDVGRAELERQLDDYFAKARPEFFRLHVAGDFIDSLYAELWARVAARHPGTKFLAFTKAWDAIRYITFPENFSVVLSAWPGTEIPADLAMRYATAYVDDGTESLPDALPCPGNCEVCGACWSLAKNGLNVKFRKH